MRAIWLGLGLATLACGGTDGDEARNLASGAGGSGGSSGASGAGSTGTGGGSVGGSGSAASGSGGSGGSGGEEHWCTMPSDEFERAAPRDGLYLVQIEHRLPGFQTCGAPEDCNCEDLVRIEPVQLDGAPPDGCTVTTPLTWFEAEDPSTPVYGYDAAPACTAEVAYTCPVGDEPPAYMPGARTVGGASDSEAANLCNHADGECPWQSIDYTWRSFAVGSSGDSIYGQVRVVVTNTDGSAWCRQTYGFRATRLE